MTTMDIDRPVPSEERLACLMWQCYVSGLRRWSNGRYDPDPATSNWWLLDPSDRAVWIFTAEVFAEVEEVRSRGERCARCGVVKCPTCGHHEPGEDL